LESEESSLTSQFQDIEGKYKSLQAQKEAEQSVFIQQKEASIGELKDKLIEQERGLNQEYDQLFDQLDETNTDKRIGLQEHFSTIQNNKSEKQIEINECRNKQFYQHEIEQVKTLLQKGIAETTALEQEVQKSEQEIEGLRKSWTHELEIYQKEIENERANLNQRFEKLTQKKKDLEIKVQKYNHTLLAWLTNHKKDWSENIGKVIDQDLLFHDELNPQLLDQLATSFYGVGIDLKSIEGRSFSLSLLEEQLKDTLGEIEKVRKESSELDQGLIKKEQNLKKKYQPQLNKLKSFVEVSNNTIKKNKKEKERQDVLLEDWIEKGQNEKELQLVQLNKDLNGIQLQLDELKQQLSSFEEGVKQQKEVKRKEKTRRLNQFKKDFQEKENG
ncbi:ATP-binding protein, partial [Flammeovirga aprica]